MAELKRIVKMVFRPEEVPVFEAIFAQAATHIRAFPGCDYLALWQDQTDPTVFFTYSHWTGPEALEAYRHSELFRTTWSQTKPLFAAQPQAWSLSLRAELE
ncbi:MAG: antibiotic biosynthesis monooxygenase [Bacteroidetes bacterium]|nr:MAG: antibiotic biosynthesis monooxygenase [Bacteroidota bacterium]